MLCLLVSIGFQVLFHFPPGDLFTFPSRYYTLSVTRSYLALGDGPPAFPPDSSCPVVLRIPPAKLTFRLQDCHFLWCSFLSASSTLVRCIPRSIPPPIFLWSGLGSFPFAHHYSENRSFTFFSSGYLDVSVPRVPLLYTIYSYMHTVALPTVSSLIRISADQCLFATPRSFSQLVTSFFGA